MTDAVALFPLYQDEHGNASPESMESVANEIGAAKGPLDEVETELDREERVVLESVEGDLETPLGSATDEPKRRSARMRAASVVAAGAVRMFADGVRAYDGVVLDLRTEYESRHDPLPDPLEPTDEELVRELRQRQGKAYELHVDGRAEEAAALLRLVERGEIDTALHNLLLAMPSGVYGPSNGSVQFVRADELTFDPELFRELVGRLPADDLVDLLGDTALDLRIRNIILTERDYDVLPMFSEQWSLSDVDPIPSWNCDYGQWVIVGPDGRRYFVTAPPTTDGDPTLEPNHGPDSYDSIDGDGPGSGWTTVDESLAPAAYGERMDTLSMRIAGVLSMGVAHPVGEWQSLSDDQTELLTSDDGVLYVNDGTQPTPDYQRPPSGPVPDSHPQSPAVDGLDAVISALEGWKNVDQMEANRHYATQVVFQEHEDGTRRAVLTLNQVQTDGNGNVRIHQVPAQLNADGSVSRTGS